MTISHSRYQSRETVEAVQYDGQLATIESFLPGLMISIPSCFGEKERQINVHVSNTIYVLDKGDWILKMRGSVRVMKCSEFFEKFEEEMTSPSDPTSSLPNEQQIIPPFLPTLVDPMKWEVYIDQVRINFRVETEWIEESLLWRETHEPFHHEDSLDRYSTKSCLGWDRFLRHRVDSLKENISVLTQALDYRRLHARENE